MYRIAGTVIICLFFPMLSPVFAQERLDLEYCVEYAIKNSPEVKEVSQGIKDYEGKLAQAKAARYPRIDLLTYIAPTYSVYGDALSYEKDYDKWGPFLYSKMEVKQPIYTWGKLRNYRLAAEKGIQVAELEAVQKTNEVSYEVKKYYYGLIMARKLKSVVEDIMSTLSDAIDSAERLYMEGTGEVRKSELEELKVYMAEAEKNYNEAVKSVRLARLALMQKMGMEEVADFDIVDDTLKPVSGELSPVDEYIDMAFQNRPEWNMLQAGLAARDSLVKAERSGYYPVIFAGGELRYNWTSAREDQTNPWLNDDFNIFDGGVAVGAMLTLNHSDVHAKVKSNEAEYLKLKEKELFARTGIILQVKKAYYEIKQYSDNITSARKGRTAARKWVMSAGLGYSFGTGQAEEALKGLAARAKAEKDYYQAVYDYNMAWADLSRCVGVELTSLDGYE